MAIKKQKITVVGTIVTIAYPSIGKTIVEDVSKHPIETQFAAKMHGYKQGYGDNKSGGTPLEKYEMTLRKIDAHRRGSWKLDTREENLEIVLEAAARLTGQDVEDVEAELEEKYKTEAKIEERLKELRSTPKFVAEIAAIRSERATAIAATSTDEVVL